MKDSHPQLIASIVTKFAPRHVRRPRIFLPGRKRDRSALRDLGISPWASIAFPEVVIHDLERDWLFLIDVVRGKPPIDEHRREQLTSLFSESGKHLILFSAFLDREAYARHVEAIAWETHVWTADVPDHMIHFSPDGRFLGPHQRPESAGKLSCFG